MSSSVKVATWNTKQGVAPRQKEDVLWRWIQNTIDADVIVLTEAKAPKAGFPNGWTGVWVPGGVGKGRPWGTVIAGKGLEFQSSEFKRRKSKLDDDRPHPATSFAVDVFKNDEYLFCLYGHYGLMLQNMDGSDALHGATNELDDIIRDRGPQKLICAGDFNAWPFRLRGWFNTLDMLSVTDLRKEFPVLRDPVEGSRIWTHKNGAKHTDGARQELDFIFISKDLKRKVVEIKGGVDDFPDAWDMSDHAPVVVTLNL
jgi:exonuclease III